MPERTNELIGTFAGHQISASEYLRAASITDSEMTDTQRLQALDKAAMHAEAGTRTSTNMYERALAYAQYQCAMGIAMLVRNHIETQRVDDGLQGKD